MVPIHLIWDKSDKYSPKISKICPKLDPNEISHEEQAEDGWRMGWALNANRKRQPKKTMMDDSKHSNSSFCIMRDNAVINTWIHRSIKIHTYMYICIHSVYVCTYMNNYIYNIYNTDTTMSCIQIYNMMIYDVWTPWFLVGKNLRTKPLPSKSRDSLGWLMMATSPASRRNPINMAIPKKKMRSGDLIQLW